MGGSPSWKDEGGGGLNRAGIEGGSSRRRVVVSGMSDTQAYLEEVRALPKRLVDKLEGVEGNLKVYLVQDYDHSLLSRIVRFGDRVFGEASMDEWGLVPQIKHGNVYVLKEEDSRRIIGLAILMRDWEEPEKCYLYDFAIAGDFRGKGLGYHFLLAVARSVREQGFARMGLTVDTENLPAIALYKKAGFLVHHLSGDHYGPGHHRYVMRLDLSNIPGKEEGPAH